MARSWRVESLRSALIATRRRFLVGSARVRVR
jgi:hypothetical protein